MNLRHSSSLVARALCDFLTFSPLKIIAVNCGSVIQGLSVSAGILLILPLAQLAGVDFNQQANSPWGFLSHVANWISTLPLSQNLEGILLLYALLTTLVASLSYYRTIMGVRIQQGYTKHVRMMIYQTLLQARWEYLATNRSAEFLHRLGTQSQSMSTVANQMIALLHKLLTMTVYTILMLAVNWQFTAMTFICGLLIAFIVFPIRWQVRDAGQRHLKGYQAIFKLLSEHLGSLKMIKGSGHEWYFRTQLHNASNELEEQQTRIARAGAIIAFANTIGLAIGFSVMLYFAVTWLNVPIANFFLLLLIMSRLMPQLAGLQQTIQQIHFSLPAYQDIEDTLNAGRAAQEIHLDDTIKRQGLQHSINLNNVSYRYPKAKQHTIKPLTLHIPARHTFALIGPSGIGKTTLADLIVGLIKPESGHVLIDEKELSGALISQWRRSIAYVTQDTFLFNDSIRNNLKWVNPDASDNELWQAIEHAALTQCIQQLPNGLDCIIGDRGIRLSGGERQRLAIARALISKPDLLILDEATSALDNDNETLIHQALMNLHGTLTVIIISHRMTTIQHADMVLDMSLNPPVLRTIEQVNTMNIMPECTL